MPADFVAALRAEIAALESALAADPRFRKLDLIRRTLALYEDAAVAALAEPSEEMVSAVPDYRHLAEHCWRAMMRKVLGEEP